MTKLETQIKEKFNLLFEDQVPDGYSLCMVLNDGETFSALNGCKIVAIPESAFDLDLSDQMIKDGEDTSETVIQECDGAKPIII